MNSKTSKKTDSGDTEEKEEGKITFDKERDITSTILKEAGETIAKFGTLAN